MPSYSKGDVVLVQYPFSDLSDTKVRPAIAVSAPHQSQERFRSSPDKQDRSSPRWRVRDERLEGRGSQRNVSGKARPLYDSSKPNHQKSR